MNQDYALSGARENSSILSSINKLSGTHKIIAAFVVALVILVIFYLIFGNPFTKAAAKDAFMMPSTTMRQQVAYFPEAMTSGGSSSCGVTESADEEAYKWAQSEIGSGGGESMSNRKTDNALSLTLQGY